MFSDFSEYSNNGAIEPSETHGIVRKHPQLFVTPLCKLPELTMVIFPHSHLHKKVRTTFFKAYNVDYG